MINFFRTNQPLIAYILLPVAILFMLPVFVLNQPYEFNFFLGSFFSKTPLLLQHMLVLLLLFFNAININSFVAKYLIPKEKNYLAGLFYLLLTSVQLYWFGFSGFMVATIFLLPSLSYILSINHQKKILDLSFRAGFWLGISILFENSLIVLMIFYLFLFFFSRSRSLRESFVLIVGLLIPFFFYLPYFLINNLPLLNNDFHFGLPTIQDFWLKISLFEKIFLFSSLFIFIISILSFQKNLQKSVHNDKISKKTFFIVGIGMVIISLFNSFINFTDYLTILTFILATTIPSFFLVFRKEKIGKLTLNLYVYLIIFLIVVDYFY